MADETKDWKKFKDKNETLSDVEDDEGSNGGTDEAHQPEGILGHPSYQALEEELTLAEQKAHENWEKAVRAVAELENFRKRAERDVANAHRYGLEKFIVALLPVIDSLEQALQMTAQNDQPDMHEGLTLTLKMFLDILNKQGVLSIDPIGELFNPEEHEAMSMQEDPTALPNTVVMVFQKGYKLNDRVIRPARVIVAKKSGE